ncbi:MAG: calcium/sodium antiporter [Verrucomicrobiota bacterium]
MWMDGVYLVAGLALIIQGGSLFVAAAVRLAEFLRLPRVVVGSTLVSLATTTPELAVSIMSGVRGESGLAVGNALGSCLCNIGLILGISALLKTVEVHRQVIRLPLLVMSGAGLLLGLFLLDGFLSPVEGWVLITAGVGYFIYDFRRHWLTRSPAQVAEAGAIELEAARTGRAWFRTPAGSGMQFIAGAGVVVLGSRLLVDGAGQLAGELGVPSLVIGLTVVAVGTSLPELITAITSARHSVSDLAVGNVLGANIANLTLIVGAAAVFHGVSIEPGSQWLNLGALLATFGTLGWMLLRDPRLSRREGTWLLAGYSAYLAGVVALSLVRGR